MTDKLRLATVWLGGCSGCHMSFLDMDEFLFDLADRVELVFSPLVDAKEFPDGVDLTLVEGAVANEDNRELAHKVRARSANACMRSSSVLKGRTRYTRPQRSREARSGRHRGSSAGACREAVSRACPCSFMRS